MDNKDSLAKGGISIIHQLIDGKHTYEVEDVVKFKKVNGGNAFARKGDKLLMVNNIDLQDVTPEVLAQLLSKGNAMLTVHKASKTQLLPDQAFSEQDVLHPVSKEPALLSFSLEMRLEKDLEEDWMTDGVEGGETGSCEAEVWPHENGEDGQEGDVYLIALVNTSISVVTGRGCGASSDCGCSEGKECKFNEVVMVADSSKVTLIPRGTANFKHEKTQENISIEHFLSHKYLRAICSRKMAYVDPSPERMTIYYYKADLHSSEFRGLPVVLNFTDSNCFLKCCKEGEKVLLRVETCEKQALKQISKSDETTMPFVFYMKSTRTNQRRFESAFCLGWFIHLINTEQLEVCESDSPSADPSFFFVIR